MLESEDAFLVPGPLPLRVGLIADFSLPPVPVDPRVVSRRDLLGLAGSLMSRPRPGGSLRVFFKLWKKPEQLSARRVYHPSMVLVSWALDMCQGASPLGMRSLWAAPSRSRIVDRPMRGFTCDPACSGSHIFPPCSWSEDPLSSRGLG
ncbi:uncharacterized protein [Oryctolagus cuniculus]|uniref:uncharacterized protein n=1 Tax=Oryctolagus cuniculus TaxID=9986 RepID=UPI00387929F2